MPIPTYHPMYLKRADTWKRFELTAKGGREFLNKFLKHFTSRENFPDFVRRKDISYCSAIAKKSVIRVINSIVQRMIDVNREGGPKTYQEAIEASGIDFHGNTMNSFMARKVIPDLLNIGKVGVYIDKPLIPEGSTRKDTNQIRPYLYVYKALDILSWNFDKMNRLVSLLLRDNINVVDETTGLIKREEIEYRLLRMKKEGVLVEWYDQQGVLQDKRTIILNLKEIPFVIFELNMSLLEDVADHQIAATNLASSDVHFGTTANFPFYVEMISNQDFASHIRGSGPDTPVHLDTKGSAVANAPQPGTAGYAAQSRAHAIRVGAAQGRSYPQGMDRPGFINPSSEPLMASMKKQEAIAQEVDRLVEQTLTNVDAKRVRQRPGEKPNSGLEAGLSNIAVELEYGERRIVQIWAMYEDDDSDFTVDYPEHYSLRTEHDIREEITELRKSLPTLPSLTYQRTIAKRIAVLELRGKVAKTKLDDIANEIDEAKVVANDPDVIRLDHEDGLISDELASRARLYPAGEHIQAREDRAIRVKLTLDAQTKSVSGVRETQGDLKLPPSRGDQEAKTDKEK